MARTIFRLSTARVARRIGPLAARNHELTRLLRPVAAGCSLGLVAGATAAAAANLLVSCESPASTSSASRRIEEYAAASPKRPSTDVRLRRAAATTS